jgi:hypothetical protein
VYSFEKLWFSALKFIEKIQIIYYYLPKESNGRCVLDISVAKAWPRGRYWLHRADMFCLCVAGGFFSVTFNLAESYRSHRFISW